MMSPCCSVALGASGSHAKYTVRSFFCLVNHFFLNLSAAQIERGVETAVERLHTSLQNRRYLQAAQRARKRVGSGTLSV